MALSRWRSFFEERLMSVDFRFAKSERMYEFLPSKIKNQYSSTAIRTHFARLRLGFRFQLWLSFFPQRAVDFFIERRATGRVLAKRMVFRPHQVRAVRECSADSLALKVTVFLKLPGKIGM